MIRNPAHKQTAPIIPPSKVAEEIAKRNGQGDLAKKIQDPARGNPQRGGK